MTDRELFVDCLKHLSLMYNDNVPIIVSLKKRLFDTQKPSLWRKRNDKGREEIPVKSS